MYVRVSELPPELQRQAKRERDAFLFQRLRIIILAIQGWTPPAVAKAVGLSRRECQE